jgi:hypothetical protein
MGVSDRRVYTTRKACVEGGGMQSSQLSIKSYWFISKEPMRLNLLMPRYVPVRHEVLAISRDFPEGSPDVTNRGFSPKQPPSPLALNLVESLRAIDSGG